MKKFNFSQKNLLDIRIAQKKAVEQLLQQQANKVEYEKQIYNECQQSLINVQHQEWIRKMPIAEFSQYKQQQIKLWKYKTIKQQQYLKKSEDLYNEYIEDFKLAIQECQKLEKICQKERKVWQVEHNRHEIKIIDEIASRKSFYAS